MIIWRGWGWLTIVVAVVSFFISGFTVNAITGGSSTYLSTVITLLMTGAFIGLFGYYINVKKRKVVLDEAGNVVAKAPSHSLFFIPVQYWGIILPAVFIWADYNNQQTEKDDLVFLSAPAVNDKYLVDFSHFYQNTDDKYKYGVFKVTEVNGEQVSGWMSENAYSKKSAVRKEINKDNADQDSFYEQELVSLEISKLLPLKEAGAIEHVYRD
ncbi:hypothetical protein K6Y31_06830 [Motilimonas cestriensis]|uniref:Uncharacterized protein n=1 Tax=Motilimonas cestriensis TaxID=2742685 RepID=A0ABS8W8C3_9GAMM|nr:hypothetical protein [Motilimonas cestriensis]MCE2594525.1 hypothetical protein [Motilimonas cestriensis]